ncbi:hypothetical protein EXIGLDRAFT_211060 [Exidia glandulosa HHB12029]|uniref:REJ domain-containing protein n=1 Tax=Exidia glandulosa HHB12029 TaxID=1314781 RepID=A0A165EJR3_EXIGL|nr:hypothetical protein EXIGLDRAFT_211060 [Exidia glandulosa HHB12029]
MHTCLAPSCFLSCSLCSLLLPPDPVYIQSRSSLVAPSASHSVACNSVSFTVSVQLPCLVPRSALHVLTSHSLYSLISLSLSLSPSLRHSHNNLSISSLACFRSRTLYPLSQRLSRRSRTTFIVYVLRSFAN